MLEGGYVAVARPTYPVGSAGIMRSSTGVYYAGHGSGAALTEGDDRVPQVTNHKGDQELGAEQFGQMLRVYWNVSPEGALSLMRLITERLNMICVPFRLKVVAVCGA